MWSLDGDRDEAAGCEVNKCTEAGGIFKFYVADWFALMNDKMGGDMKKIKVRQSRWSMTNHAFVSQIVGNLTNFVSSSSHFGHILMCHVVCLLSHCAFGA